MFLRVGVSKWIEVCLTLVAPQVLERHGVVVLYVEPRHLVHFGVDARVLPLHVGVVVVVLELAQRLLRLDVVGALESRCARLDVECSMSVYLSRRG